MDFYNDLPYRVSAMQLEDIEQVMAIEVRSFSSPWSVRAYRYEVANNNYSQFVVVREAQLPQPPQADEQPTGLLNRFFAAPARPMLPPILGYAGFWLLVDEAHISTIAVAPEWRGMGLGELLLVALLDRAVQVRAEVATLEVRVTNQVAQNLYRKHGFQTVGLRKGYYTDNGEDALVLTTPPLRSMAYQELLAQNKVELARKLKARLRRPWPNPAISQMG